MPSAEIHNGVVYFREMEWYLKQGCCLSTLNITKNIFLYVNYFPMYPLFNLATIPKEKKQLICLRIIGCLENKKDVLEKHVFVLRVRN